MTNPCQLVTRCREGHTVYPATCKHTNIDEIKILTSIITQMAKGSLRNVFFWFQQRAVSYPRCVLSLNPVAVQISEILRGFVWEKVAGGQEFFPYKSSYHFWYLNCRQILYSNATDLKLGNSTYFFLLFSFLVLTKCQVSNVRVGKSRDQVLQRAYCAVHNWDQRFVALSTGHWTATRQYPDLNSPNLPWTKCMNRVGRTGS